MSTCFKRNFNFLASLCSLGDWFESRFVGNPEDRFSHDEAQIIINNPPEFQHKNSGVVVDVRGLFFIWDLEMVVGWYRPKMFLRFVVAGVPRISGTFWVC